MEDRPITPGTASGSNLNKKHQLRISSLPKETKGMLDDYAQKEGHTTNAAAAQFILHQFLKDYNEKKRI